MNRRRPNFFIVGAAKSGTTSVFHYINQHPDVFMSPVKEPHYFSSLDFPERFAGPGDEGFTLQTVRTEADYLQLFADAGEATVLGEGSVYYLNYPQAAERIRVFNPNAKIVMLLRNPIDRAFSAYMHTVRDGRETLSFEEGLEAEAKRIEQNYQPLWWYKEVGRYAKAVEHYQQFFPRDQLKIFLYEDLANADKVVQELLSFLNLRTDVTIDTGVRHNISGKPKSRALYTFFAKPNLVKEVVKPFLPTSFRQRLGQKAKDLTLEKDRPSAKTVKNLQRYFREDVLSLQDLLHRDLKHWLV